VVARALAQVEALDARDELAAPLGLAAGQVGVGRVVGQERGVVDYADLRLARLPVLGVGHVLDVLRGAVAAAGGEGAGADRVLVRVGDRVRDLGPDLLVHDADLVGDVVEVRHRGRLEGHHDLVRAGHHDAGQHRPDGVDVQGGVLLHQVERVGDVRGGHRVTVGELHAAPDGEGDHLVAVAPGVAAGQPRRGRVVLQGVDEHQRLVDGPERKRDIAQVERVEVAGPGAAALVVDGERAART
jgi:hypothetical protein